MTPVVGAMTHPIILVLNLFQRAVFSAAFGECVYFDEPPTCAIVGEIYLCCDSDECVAFLPKPECRDTMCCGELAE